VGAAAARTPGEGAAPLPYWRLSGFYFFYFASLGALVPYWGLYLAALGYGAGAIGELTAILTATKIVAPNVWGWVADHRGRRMAIVRLASLLSAIAFAGVLLGSGYLWLALVLTVFSFFWNAALPQLEATTFSHLGDGAHRYTHIRVWGSIGFILAVTALGWALDRHGPQLLPGVVLALMVAIWAATLLVPERAAGHLHLGHEPLSRVLRRPAVVGLIAACFLAQMSHGPYYAFYSIYLQGYGYSRSAIGVLWALGVAAEVVLYVVMHRVLARHALRPLFLLSLVLTAARWVLIGLFPLQVGVLLVAQVLHAASFGLYHAVAIQLFHRYFVGRHQGRGQALYSSMSFGAGGAAGALASGYAWEGVGPGTTYLAAAVVAAAGAYIVWRWVEEPAGAARRPVPSPPRAD
jgi:PPP family 3-phenylpropionic acid transporter